MESSRSLNQINTILNLAKLSESDVQKESLILSFIPQIVDSKQVKLLEINKDTLDYINSGESLYVKGDKDSNVVICTNSSTFELKEAETSNSLLLTPNLSDASVIETSGERVLKNQKVSGIYHIYYEMKPIKPKFQLLRAVLSSHTYKSKDMEFDEEPKGLTFTELKTQILASEAELLNELNELHTVKVKGRWRLLDIGLLYGWVTHLDTILRGRQVSLKEVTAEDIQEWMMLYEIPEVNEKCVSMFTESVQGNLKWNSSAISKLFALYLLPELRAFDSKDFFAAWQESVPLGVETLEEHLRGVAIVDHESTPSLVRYLPEFELPEGVNERLDVLFRTRSKWLLQDIAPYIKALTDDTQDVAALLTKHARTSTVNGMKYYSSKYATN